MCIKHELSSRAPILTIYEFVQLFGNFYLHGSGQSFAHQHTYVRKEKKKYDNSKQGEIWSKNNVPNRSYATYKTTTDKRISAALSNNAILYVGVFVAPLFYTSQT